LLLPQKALGPRIDQQLAKFLNRQAGILYDPAQRERLDRIVPRNCDLAWSIAHDNVLALANDREARLFQSPYRIQVIDPRNPWHG
jgi:hypothetical protein